MNVRLVRLVLPDEHALSVRGRWTGLDFRFALPCRPKYPSPGCARSGRVIEAPTLGDIRVLFVFVSTSVTGWGRAVCTMQIRGHLQGGVQAGGCEWHEPGMQEWGDVRIVWARSALPSVFPHLRLQHV